MGGSESIYYILESECYILYKYKVNVKLKEAMGKGKFYLPSTHF